MGRAGEVRTWVTQMLLLSRKLCLHGPNPDTRVQHLDSLEGVEAYALKGSPTPDRSFQLSQCFGKQLPTFNTPLQLAGVHPIFVSGSRMTYLRNHN